MHTMSPGAFAVSSGTAGGCMQHPVRAWLASAGVLLQDREYLYKQET